MKSHSLLIPRPVLTLASQFQGLVLITYFYKNLSGIVFASSFSEAQTEVVKPTPVARPVPPPYQPIAFSSRTNIPLIPGGGTRQIPILAQPVEP